MAEKRRAGRQRAVSEHKRELILDAAREVFAAEGLEGASLRAIATRSWIHAGGALFPFRLEGSDLCRGAARLLASLGGTVDEAVANTRGPKQKLRAAAMAFFRYYAENPAIWISASTCSAVA